MEIKMYKKQNQSGFALLITIILVSVILSIGLSILDLSIKQVRLSSNATESEISFHAANAGAECARYWRRESSAQFLLGQAITPECFGVSVGLNNVRVIPVGLPADALPRVVGDGQAFQYRYEFTWGADPRCTQINTIVIVSDPVGSGATTTNMSQLVAGYPGDTEEFYCRAGSQCTTISVKGYSRPCSTLSGFGTVQREVLLQY